MASTAFELRMADIAADDERQRRARRKAQAQAQDILNLRAEIDAQTQRIGELEAVAYAQALKIEELEADMRRLCQAISLREGHVAGGRELGGGTT